MTYTYIFYDFEDDEICLLEWGLPSEGWLFGMKDSSYLFLGEL